MNDTDRDLVRKAAKAAGIEVDLITRLDCGVTDAYWVELPAHAYHFRLKQYPHTKWSPLTDDGDCARLEAACMLDVEWQTQHVIVGRTMLDKWQEPYMLHDGDKQAARRFAAVRAAASMADPIQSQDT